MRTSDRHSWASSAPIAHVAAGDQAQGSAEGRALDHGQGRHLQARQVVHQFRQLAGVVEVALEVQRRALLHPGQVGAGAEVSAAAAQDDETQARIVGQLIDSDDQFADHQGVERILCLVLGAEHLAAALALFALDLGQHAGRLLGAHHADPRVRPHPQEARVVGAAAHAVVAGAEAPADDHGELRHLGAGHRSDQFGAVLGDAAGLVFLPDHEAGDVLQEQQRDTALAGQFDEVRAFLRGLGEEDAVVGQDRDGVAVQFALLVPVEVGHAAAGDGQGVFVVVGVVVGDTAGLAVHVGAAEVLGADHLAGGRLHQRRAGEEDGGLLADHDGLVGHRRHIGAAGGARAHDHGDLRDALGAHVGLVEEDPPELATDQHAADLAGAGADLVELGVAQQAAGREFVDVAVAAEDLDRFQGHLGGAFGGVEDHPGSVLARGLGAVAGLGHGVQVGAAGVELGVHVGDLALDQLELADALAELLAVVDIRNDQVHARLHDAGRAAGEDHALVVQAAHQHLHAAVELAEDVLRRYLDVVEEQFAGVGTAHAQLVELVAAGEAFPVTLDDECGDAVRALVQVGLGVDHVGVGVRAVGDPGLAAVEDEMVAALFGAQLHRDHVGTGIRLAHGQGADMLAADQLGQVLELLLVAAVAVDLVDAEVGVGAVGEGHRGRPAADFLHGHDMGQVTQAGAAVFLADGHAEQAHVAELAPHVGGEQSPCCQSSP
ncbi:hypothetical protein L1887_57426 [Cichorium endivia]|nr:hypothetical protein L1887_57426 [Cichorium endivia]